MMHGNYYLAAVHRWLREKFGSDRISAIAESYDRETLVPDLKNGRPASHPDGYRNHVHFANGGILPPGLTWAYNDSGESEKVEPPEDDEGTAGKAA